MLPTVVLAKPPNAPADVLTRNQAASVLGLSPNTVSKLLASQFLSDLQASRVVALSRAPHVTVKSGLLPVLRTAAAAPPTLPGDLRSFLGDSVGLSDTEFLEASRQWWRCDPDVIVSAGLLCVAIAGWVTGVLAITGIDSTQRLGPGEVRHAFEAEVVGRVGALDDPATFRVLTQDPAMAGLTRQLLGSRVQAAVSGGPIAYLTP
jgi:hypothetical protein